MLPIEFIIIAVAMRLLGGVSYLRAVIRGKAHPYPLSWLLWSITPMIIFAAEIQAGVGMQALVTLALGVSPLLVFIVSMIKNPRALKLDTLNIMCGLIAVAGIGLWYITDTPAVAIIISIIADIFSAIPTIRKAFKKPKTEHAPTYMLSAGSMIITLLTITEWTFATYAFPVYVLAINLLILWTIKRPT